MSYYQPSPSVGYSSSGTTPLRQFVPNYQARSDYLPGVVKDGVNPTTADLVEIT
jgi:hypothetical protein